MIKVSLKLEKVAKVAHDRGYHVIARRLFRASVLLAATDTIKLIDDGLEEDIESGNYPFDEEESSSEDDDQEVEEAEDDDSSASFTGFPVGALPHKERRKGPHPKDVGVAKPDWWNP
tara:strand:- start:33 stop:383 length:351 start_codon:yes stop_codon:yes gene_type:complete